MGWRVVACAQAWFHATEVLHGHGESIAAAYYSGGIPFFGIHRNVSSLALSPLGFGACTGEGPDSLVPASTGDWFARSAAWEAVLQPELPVFEFAPAEEGTVRPPPLAATEAAEVVAEPPADGGGVTASQQNGAWGCEVFCQDTPCPGLNGDVRSECGRCSASFACNPQAAGWPSSRRDEL